MTTTSTGANPPQGAIIYYTVKDEKAEASRSRGKDKDKDKDHDAENRVKVEILDASDHVVRSFPTPGRREEKGSASPDEEVPRGASMAQPTAHAGLNRFVWDMRYEAATSVPRLALWHVSPGGPYAVPGHYKVRLTVDGKSQTQPFDIVANPSLTVTQAQLQAQFDLLTAINTQLNAVQTAVLEIRALHRQLAAIPAGDTKEAAEALDRKADAVEDKLTQKKSIASEDPLNFPIRLNNMLASLATTVGQGDTEPTKPEYAEFDELKAQAAAGVGEWQAIKSADVAKFNAQLGRKKLPPITLVASAERKSEQLQYGDEVADDDDDDR